MEDLYREMLEISDKYATRGHHAFAIKLLRLLTTEYPGQVDAFHRLGIAYRSAGEFEQALASFDAALKLVPNFHFTLIELGLTHEQLGDSATAICFYRQAMSSQPAYPMSYVFAARLERKTGDSYVALDWLMRGLPLCLDDAEIAAEIAHTLVFQNRREEAFVYYRRALDLAPERDDIRLDFVLALNSIGRYDDVLRETLRVTDKSDYSSMLHGHAKLALGESRARLDQALQSCQRSSDWVDILALRDAIKEAQRTASAFSFIRLYDGEARFILYFDVALRARLGIDECNAIGSVIWRNWFGQAISDVEPRTLEGIFRQVVDSIRTADILGIPTAERLGRDFSHFGYLSHLCDWLYQIRSAEGHGSLLTDALANIQLHELTPFYRDILDGLPFLGVVSCHPDLGSALGKLHGIGSIRTYLLPAEQGMSHIPPKLKTGEHFPTVFEAAMSSLEVPSPGALFLVAGGLLGKIYCARIRQLGGIALDVGSIVDAWMGFNTRPGSYDRIDEWRLPGTDERIV